MKMMLKKLNAVKLRAFTLIEMLVVLLIISILLLLFVPNLSKQKSFSGPLIIIGLMFNGQMSAMLINLGILLFSLAVLFQIVTLPVEFNASHRAVNVLETAGMLHPEEISGVKKVLGAAALTYVASAAAQILQLLRLLILTRGRRDD